MTYKLFLDDERLPVEGNWVVVRNYDAAVVAVETLGMPYYISFDHDLGDSRTGYDFAKYLVEYDLLHDVWRKSEDFSYYVHSQNPIGKENIERYLESYLLQKFMSGIV